MEVNVSVYTPHILWTVILGTSPEKCFILLIMLRYVLSFAVETYDVRDFYLKKHFTQLLCVWQPHHMLSSHHTVCLRGDALGGDVLKCTGGLHESQSSSPNPHWDHSGKCLVNTQSRLVMIDKKCTPEPRQPPKDAQGYIIKPGSAV